MRILRALPQSATPMPSAAKCPLLIAFEVETSRKGGGPAGGAPDGRPGSSSRPPPRQACIFKVGDDCRQDVLALQVIDLLQREFKAAHLPLYLAPYGVLPTGYERGVIEVVPEAKSRAGVGELADGGLREVWLREFGPPGSERYERARENLIRSCAAYAVASYLLQSKDRHNGNILLDSQGHVVHIDFGFILGISPGGNLGFESAPFKLSYEMTQLLDPGSRRASKPWRRFCALCVRGFLAARHSAAHVVAAVAMMETSGLPCFSRGRSVQLLRQRFVPHLSDALAAQHMLRLIEQAYDKWTTGFYDYVQYLQNGIPK
ncbi:hypothetical protein H632_c3172p0 [Helicosporidium sp. ATCC 50920]|nr:hypothetical protein H632_c3172p0 [Helicosporidium sp. ATCC 50920]|eukprot:KDD72577.1 hypothetical protein H632_c3172p0 [Helicosporidium sp. ATCC 50920]